MRLSILHGIHDKKQTYCKRVQLSACKQDNNKIKVVTLGCNKLHASLLSSGYTCVTFLCVLFLNTSKQFVICWTKEEYKIDVARDKGYK